MARAADKSVDLRRVTFENPNIPYGDALRTTFRDHYYKIKNHARSIETLDIRWPILAWAVLYYRIHFPWLKAATLWSEPSGPDVQKMDDVLDEEKKLVAPDAALGAEFVGRFTRRHASTLSSLTIDLSWDSAFVLRYRALFPMLKGAFNNVPDGTEAASAVLKEKLDAIAADGFWFEPDELSRLSAKGWGAAISAAARPDAVPRAVDLKVNNAEKARVMYYLVGGLVRHARKDTRVHLGLLLQDGSSAEHDALLKYLVDLQGRGSIRISSITVLWGVDAIDQIYALISACRRDLKRMRIRHYQLAWHALMLPFRESQTVYESLKEVDLTWGMAGSGKGPHWLPVDLRDELVHTSDIKVHADAMAGYIVRFISGHEKTLIRAVFAHLWYHPIVIGWRLKHPRIEGMFATAQLLGPTDRDALAATLNAISISTPMNTHVEIPVADLDRLKALYPDMVPHNFQAATRLEPSISAPAPAHDAWFDPYATVRGKRPQPLAPVDVGSGWEHSGPAPAGRARQAAPGSGRDTALGAASTLVKAVHPNPGPDPFAHGAAAGPSMPPPPPRQQRSGAGTPMQARPVEVAPVGRGDERRVAAMLEQLRTANRATQPAASDSASKRNRTEPDDGRTGMLS